MTITKDATKGWARPANASEWTELLAGTGLPNPDSAWPCTEASGNLADVIGSLTLTAAGTPLYAQTATGWAGTGIGADDGVNEGFAAASGTGPDPTTTSQAWLFVLAIQTEPTATRVIGGINVTNAATGCRIQLNPSAGTNRVSINCFNVTANGTADHTAGDYVFAMRYDRAATVAKAYSDLESVAGTYSASVADGQKGVFRQAAPGSVVCMYVAMWSGANAESLDDTDIATIRSKIQSPPTGTVEEPDRPPTGRVAPWFFAQPASRPAADEAGVFANFALELDYQYRPRVTPLTFLPPPVSRAFVYDEIYQIAAFGLEAEYQYRPQPRPLEMQRHTLHHYSDELAIAQPTAPVGTTAAAIAAGNLNYKWIAAIEGYQYLLTNATTTQATDAWSGSGFTSALGGLYVRVNLDNEIDPWDPHAASGGRLTLQVAQSTSGDTFGVDLSKKTDVSDGIDSAIAASIDSDDSTITVDHTTGFSSSGVAYVGTEAFRYASKTTTTFQSAQRGVYAPFRTANSGIQGFGHPHEIVSDAGIQSISLKPVISDEPRAWVGKRVGLWQHLYDPGTDLLNRRNDARCIFAGRIKSYRDNPTTMTMDVEVEHELAYLARAVVGENMWTAKVVDGIYLAEGQTFTLTEFTGAAFHTATPLTVIAEGGTPASSYEVAADYYTLPQIIGHFNNWMAQADTDGDIDGIYRIGTMGQPDGLTHGKFTYKIVGSGNNRYVEVGLPWVVHRALGTFAGATGAPQANQSFWRSSGDGNFHREASVNGALRIAGAKYQLENEFGDFFEQITTTIPGGLVGLFGPTPFPGESAFCLLRGVGDASIACAVIKNGTEITRCTLFDTATSQPLVPSEIEVPFDAPQDVTFTQYLHIVGPFWQVMCRLAMSTGTTGFNHPDHDVYPTAMGLAIPGELLRFFEASVRALPHADDDMVIVLTRPTKLADLLEGDLGLRFAFFRWRAGGIEMGTWQTPTVEASVVTLTEANKASPAGNEDEQRSIAETTEEWTRNLVTVHSDRDFTLENSDNYHTHTTIVDRVAIDDAGRQKRTQTINALNSYFQAFAGGSGSVSALIPHFKSIVPFFTRPVSVIRRTIAPTLFETVAVGDPVVITDGFARDPDTGQRGITARPGIIVAHSYEPGGLQPPVNGTHETAPMHGEVSVMLFDRLKIGPMVPCAQVDDTASNAGYASATKTLTCYAHKYSRTNSIRDAAWFPAGSKIRILEIDPADPAAPLSWDDTVASQSINTITLTTGINVGGGGGQAPNWNTSKKYRVVFDDYNDAASEQQSYTFQADDADGLVGNSRTAYQYTVGTTMTPVDPTSITLEPNKFPPPPLVMNSENADVELPPNASYGDAVGFDVGHHSATNRLINNLYDYKTAANNPLMFRTAIEVNGDVTHEWQLVLCVPLFLGADKLPTSVPRKLYIAPQWSSSTGNQVKARFSLAGALPTGTSALAVTRNTPYVDTEFSTTSTTVTTETAASLDIGSVKDMWGVAYLLVELQVPTASGSTIASLRGVATNYEGPRE